MPLAWASVPPPPVADGTGAAAAHVLPQLAGGQAYPTYAAAIGALDRPALFENRVCYRLLDAELAGVPGLRFGPARYFDAVNLGHAVAHELTAAWAASGTAPDGPLRTGMAWTGLPWTGPPEPDCPDRLPWTGAPCRCAPRWVTLARCPAAVLSPPSPP